MCVFVYMCVHESAPVNCLCVHACGVFVAVRAPVQLGSPSSLALFAFWRRRPGEWLPRQPDHQLLGSTSCSFFTEGGGRYFGKHWSEEEVAER